MPSFLRRPEAALFALVLGAYAYFYQAGGWNQNSRYDLTRAIVEKHTSRIDGYLRNTGDLAVRGPHTYCDKAPGLSWLAVPPVALVHAVDPSATRSAWTVWLATLTAVALPSAAACVLLALLLAAWGLRPGPACAVAAAWALATLAWPYGTLLYGHQTTAALLVIAFALLAIPRARGQAARPLRLLLTGLALGAAVTVEYPAALAALVIGGYALRTQGVRSAVWLALGAAPPLAALAAYHAIVFGAPWTTPYAFSTQANRSQGFFMGIGVPRPEALFGILFSDFRGLFFSAPWLALAVPGAVRLWRAGRAAETVVCAAIAVLFLWLNASLVDWQGGWAMGPRYLVPCLPFLALAVGGLFLPPGARPVVRVLAAALVAYSAFAMLAGTAVKPEVHIKVRRPFTAYIYPRFLRGDLAVSTQSIDMGNAPTNAPRQAWNLGHKLGLPGLVSLVPLALWSLGCSVPILRAWRPRTRAS